MRERDIECGQQTVKPQRPTLHLRWMNRGDFAEVLPIERDCFQFPWEEADFIRVMRQRNCVLIACELESDRFKHLYSASGACPIVGYMAYDWTRTKLTLLNFGVDYRFRREGVGTAMIEKLKSKLSAEQKTRIVLHVRETNLPAQLFFRAMGFRAVNVLRGAYEDTTEDAYVFQYRFR